MITNVITIANMNMVLLEKSLADIPEGKMTFQPQGLPNHPLWTLGHLTVVRHMVNKTVGNAGDIPENWAGLFGRGTTPVADAKAYPNRETLFAAYRSFQKSICQTLATLPQERLDGPHPVEPLRPFAPKLADMLTFFLCGHDGFHLGQLADWRRASGFPRLM